MQGPTGPSIARMQRPTMRPRKKNAQAAQTGLALQSAVAQVPQGTPATPQMANQIGTAVTQQAGAAAVQGAQQQVQQNAAAGQQAVQGQQMQAGADIAARKNSLAQRAIEQGQRISNLSEDARNKIARDLNAFERDSQGQKYLNEKALSTWKLTKARDVREYEKWAQEAKQVSDKKISMLEIAQKKIEQALQAEYLKDRQSKDHRLERHLIQKKHEIEQAMARERADAANRSSMWSTGLGIAGAAVGGVYGGPAGAMAGYSVGSGAGSVAAGATA